MTQDTRPLTAEAWVVCAYDAYREADPSLGIVPASIEVPAQLPRTDTPDQSGDDPPPHPDDEVYR